MPETCRLIELAAYFFLTMYCWSFFISGSSILSAVVLKNLVSLSIGRYLQNYISLTFGVIPYGDPFKLVFLV